MIVNEADKQSHPITIMFANGLNNFVTNLRTDLIDEISSIDKKIKLAEKELAMATKKLEQQHHDYLDSCRESPPLGLPADIKMCFIKSAYDATYDLVSFLRQYIRQKRQDLKHQENYLTKVEKSYHEILRMRELVTVEYV